MSTPIAPITKASEMTSSRRTDASIRLARSIWTNLSREAVSRLREITDQHKLSIAAGDLTYLESGWYVTHTGLLGVARRNRCAGIHVRPVRKFCDPSAQRWAFEATVYKSRTCRGFVGFGDADPSNVSPLVRGAEMRVAETRAVNRALRKAYAIGICSVEEIGFPARQNPQSANGNGSFGGRTVRDRLCQLIRHHQLDAAAVKSYATEFCGVKALRDATREQVEKFVGHLSEQAEKDRSALLCQLNSYGNSKAGAA
jgi:hypothetical protein